MPYVSVIICTHNPRLDYLERTLSSLRAQTSRPEEWELLIIDNASSVPLPENLNLSWHPRARLVREEKLGLTAARLRGIRESQSGLLIFVDDDNVLAANFIELACSLSVKFPYLGAFGAGLLVPEFEVPPPPSIVSRLGMLALRTMGSPAWSNNIKDHSATPWGAGLCVRREIAESYWSIVRQLGITSILDRQGERLFCGGDDVFSWTSVRAGQGFGVFPELVITHLISARRLRERYFLRLIEDHSFSHGVLGYLWNGDLPLAAERPTWVRLTLHALKRGWFSMRCQHVDGKGKAAAIRFIKERKMQPLNFAVDTLMEKPTRVNGVSHDELFQA